MTDGRNKRDPAGFADLIPTEINGSADGINRTADWSEMDKTSGSADGINRTADWSEMDKTSGSADGINRTADWSDID